MSRQPRYIVWLIEKKGGSWVEQGDGPLTKLTAERIAREIRSLCWAVKVLPDGMSPHRPEP